MPGSRERSREIKKQVNAIREAKMFDIQDKLKEIEKEIDRLKAELVGTQDHTTVQLACIHGLLTEAAVKVHTSAYAINVAIGRGEFV